MKMRPIQLPPPSRVLALQRRLAHLERRLRGSRTRPVKKAGAS